MRNVSVEYKISMEKRTDFSPKATITFESGEVRELDRSAFTLSGSSVVEGGNTSSLPLGIVSGRQITLCLMNSDDRWSEFNFINAEIFLQIEYKLDSGVVETINVGTFKVITPESYGTTVELTAMDGTYRLDKDYSSDLDWTRPVEIGDAVRESCRKCGVTLITARFANDTLTIHEKPTGLTHRQFIGLCIMVAGANAVMDEYNRLKIVSYDKLMEYAKEDFSGGVFDGATPYRTGDDLNGGSFLPWNEGDVADGGSFNFSNVHYLYNFKNFKPETDDVIITGVQLKNSDGEIFTCGEEGYVISIQNALAIGQEQTYIDAIGEKLIGLRFRPFSGDHIGYPLAEFMDPAYIIDRKGNVYVSFISDVDFQFYGFTTFKCSADSPIRNSSSYSNVNAETLQVARRDTDKKIEGYDESVQMLTSLITESFGVFKTEEKLPDGSTVYYMHDKPTLGASQKIWKMTADAFAVSTDGGRTWRAGMDAQGNETVNVLSAVGIYADWIHGGTLTLGGINNINGRITMLNAAGRSIGYWDNTGLNVSVGTVDALTINSSNINSPTIISPSSDNSSKITIDLGQVTIANAAGTTTFGKWNKSGLTINSGYLDLDGVDIRQGIVTVGGSDSRNGTLYIKDSSGNTYGTWNTSGLTLAYGRTLTLDGASESAGSLVVGGLNNRDGYFYLRNSSNSLKIYASAYNGEFSLYGTTLYIRDSGGSQYGFWNTSQLYLYSGSIYAPTVGGSTINGSTINCSSILNFSDKLKITSDTIRAYGYNYYGSFMYGPYISMAYANDGSNSSRDRSYLNLYSSYNLSIEAGSNISLYSSDDVSVYARDDLFITAGDDLKIAGNWGIYLDTPRLIINGQYGYDNSFTVLTDVDISIWLNVYWNSLLTERFSIEYVTGVDVNWNLYKYTGTLVFNHGICV